MVTVPGQGDNPTYSWLPSRITSGQQLASWPFFPLRWKSTVIIVILPTWNICDNCDSFNLEHFQVGFVSSCFQLSFCFSSKGIGVQKEVESITYKRHPGTKSFKVEPMDLWWKYSLHLSEFPVEIEDPATKISFTLNCFRKIVPLITVERCQQLFEQKPEVKCGRPTKAATSSFCRKMTRFSALSKLGMKRSRLSARRGRV